MRHYASPGFWKQFEALPDEVKKLAEKNYRLLKSDERHPSLSFKKIDDVWSVRVGLHYRALGVDAHDGILWFWIGSHADYDKFFA